MSWKALALAKQAELSLSSVLTASGLGTVDTFLQETFQVSLPFILLVLVGSTTLLAVLKPIMGGQPSKQPEQPEKEKVEVEVTPPPPEEQQPQKPESRDERRRSVQSEKQAQQHQSPGPNTRSVDEKGLLEEIERWKAQATNAQETADRTKAELELIREKHNVAQQELSSKLESVQHEAQKMKSTNHSEIKDLRSKVEQLEKHLEQRNKKILELNSSEHALRLDFNKANSELSRLSDSETALKKQVATLKSQLNIFQDKVVISPSKAVSLEDLQQSKSLLEREVALLRQQAQELTEAENSTRTEVRTLQSQKASLELKINETEKSLEEARKANKELKQKELDGELEISRLKRIEKKTEDLAGNEAKLSTRIGELEAQLREAKAEISKLEADVKVTRTAKKNQEAEVKELQEHVDRLERNLKQAHSKLMTIEAEKSKAADLLIERERELKRHQRQLSSVQDELETVKMGDNQRREEERKKREEDRRRRLEEEERQMEEEKKKRAEERARRAKEQEEAAAAEEASRQKARAEREAARLAKEAEAQAEREEQQRLIEERRLAREKEKEARRSVEELKRVQSPPSREDSPDDFDLLSKLSSGLDADVLDALEVAESLIDPLFTNNQVFAVLRVYKDKTLVDTCPLSEGVTIIGRVPGAGGLALNYACLSRSHCQIDCKKEGCTITDLKSTNKTKIVPTLDSAGDIALAPNKPTPLANKACLILGGELRAQFFLRESDKTEAEQLEADLLTLQTELPQQRQRAKSLKKQDTMRLTKGSPLLSQLREQSFLDGSKSPQQVWSEELNTSREQKSKLLNKRLAYVASQQQLEYKRLAKEKAEQEAEYARLGAAVDYSSPSTDCAIVVPNNCAVEEDPTPAQINTTDPVLLKDSERAIRWEYSLEGKWTKRACVVKFESKAFAEGGIRRAFKLWDLSEPDVQYVGKISKKYDEARETYEKDVQMQVVCMEWARRYNLERPPKTVQFTPAWFLDLPDRTGRENIAALEIYLEGNFEKYSNNQGMVINRNRNTPQAFSHFTYERSNHQLLIIDIQGCGDLYTDPQIHSVERTDFGVGNLGERGMKQFLETHQCNAICKKLGLPHTNKDSMFAVRSLSKNTMPFPELLWSELGVLPTDQFNGMLDLEAPISPSFDLNSFVEFKAFKAHDDRVCSLYATDTLLFSGSADKSIRVWDLSEFTCISTLRGHKRAVESIVGNSKYLFSASLDGEIIVWNLETLKRVQELDDHRSDVRSLQCDETYLYSCSNDKSVKVWQIGSWKCLRTMTGHEKGIRALAVQGAILFSGGNDSSIKVWHRDREEAIYVMEGHKDWIESLATTGKYLVSAGKDKRLVCWDLSTLTCAKSIKKAHSDAIIQVLAVDDAIFTCSQDNTVKIWNPRDMSCAATLEGHDQGVESLAMNWRYLLSGSRDGAVRAWRYNTKK